MWGMFCQKREQSTVFPAYHRTVQLKTHRSWGLLWSFCSPSWAVLTAACQELGQAVQGAVRIYLPLSSPHVGICCFLSSKFIWAEEKNNTTAHQITRCSLETGVFVFLTNTTLVFSLLEYCKSSWAVYKDWQ